MPCDPSSTVSRSGHRVAAMRRRRSSSCSSGTETWKGRIVAPSAPKAMRSGQYVTAVTAVQTARKARRGGDNIGAGMIILRGCRSALGDLHDRVGEGPWGFLRQVVPDPACDEPVLVLAREFLGVSAGIRVRRAVRVALERNGWRRDCRERGQPLLEAVVFRLAFSQAEAPAVIMDDDVD